MILESLYNSILTRLTSNVPELLFFDLYYGQFETPADEEQDLPFPRPAAFIEISVLNTQSQGNKKQLAKVQFRLHVVSDVVQEVSNLESAPIRSAGLAHLQLLDKINRYLHGYNNPNVHSSCSRENIEPFDPKGLMIAHRMTYHTTMLDDSALRATENIQIVTLEQTATIDLQPGN